jgi:pyruvate,water dikinase
MKVISFSDTDATQVSLVGGKNASLGEMYNQLKASGIRVPDGFIITSNVFWEVIKTNGVEEKLNTLLNKLDVKEFSNLAETGTACRELVLNCRFSKDTASLILDFYSRLTGGQPQPVAVRSSATAEDLPGASFAGQHDSFLNINGETQLLDACMRCFASLYNDRAIKYRVTMGFEHSKVALSIGIQKMVRSDSGSAGVAFTLEPETGFRDMVYITGIWGLGENIVQGAVSPDEFYFFKPTLKSGKNALITKKLGEKTDTMVFAGAGEVNNTMKIPTPPEKRRLFVLSDAEATQLAQWCVTIEAHYKMPMDIEWAKDGIDGKIYILQARPETVHQSTQKLSVTSYRLKRKGTTIVTGKAVGGKIVAGIARILQSPSEGYKLKAGEILVTETTSPDWNAVLKKAAVIVTNKGGRTSHASIVARELGLSAVVGAEGATAKIKDGQEITVSCAEGDVGKVYDGILKWDEKEIRLDNIQMPATAPMLILADPSRALQLSQYPNMGVGLLRMEFIITNSVKIHPMALARFDDMKDGEAKALIAARTWGSASKKDFFIDTLSQGVAMVAAAFYPRDVIVRMSDFKTNEYAGLLGGKQFEPAEENPMLGFRGASRYYHERYRAGFELECAAMKKVRNEMGLANVKLMIPFCRTVEEGKKVVRLMEECGLKRGEDGLEIYVMAEIPSNVILAEEFAKVFDGFSIGSNDLTQLTMGIDRDSEIVSGIFDERNEAAKWMIATVIRKAKRCGVKIGLCGQAPSDYPEFAQFLVEQGIDSISFDADALLTGIENINKAEAILTNKKNKDELIKK